MDTVTESKMAIAISKLGGIGVILRNLEIKKQLQEIRKRNTCWCCSWSWSKEFKGKAVLKKILI